MDEEISKKFKFIALYWVKFTHKKKISLKITTI